MRWVMVKRRMVWWPTAPGWFCLFLLISIPALWWIFCSEAFLALHHPEKNATILVVEGWIGLEGLKAARIEYGRGKYDWIVATGCMTSGEWTETQSNYAKSIHSRRSRLVFNKVFSRETKVGCLSWCPEKEKRPFWHSSSQSENLIQETIAYFFEIFLSSGRKWSP